MSEELTCVFCGLPIEWGIGHRNLMACLWHLAMEVRPENDEVLFNRDWHGCNDMLLKKCEHRHEQIQELKKLEKDGLMNNEQIKQAGNKIMLPDFGFLIASTGLLQHTSVTLAMQEGRIFYAN